MSPATPRVSVVIGAYDNETTLARAARSILEQTVSDLELLIVDDGSTDQTRQVADAIAGGDARVRVLAMGENRGIARSLNHALEVAVAGLVAIQDADDWSERTRLARQLEVLEAEPAAAVVGCRMREVDEAGRELAPRTRWAEGEVSTLLMRFNPIPNSAAMYRRDAVRAAGGYDPRYRWAPEYDLWLRLAERHRLVAIPEALATREMSGRNVAARREREQVAETIVMRARAMHRRRSVRGARGLVLPAVAYLSPVPLKRARRRRLGQAP